MTPPATRLGTPALLAPIVLAITLGCNDVPIFGTAPPEPAVYLVMMKEIPADGSDGSLGDSALFGLVADLGTAYGIRYRPVDLVSVTRRSDGKEYDWGILPAAGWIENTFISGVDFESEGNLRMPWSGAAGRLGRDSIAGGEIVDLVLETGGRLVTGSTMIPTKPTITIVQSGGVTTMHWARSIGAARYVVQAETDMSTFFEISTGDTSYVLTRDRPPELTPATPYFSVVALDANLVTYRADSTVRRAGLIGASGIFGAMAGDRVAIPPP